MDNFQFHGEGFERVTGIPNSFIEEFMPTAAGEFVKIYIYLLKCAGENCSELSISKIADVFNNTEKDTIRALKYWERKGLLTLTFDGNILTSLSLNGRPDHMSVEPKKLKDRAVDVIELREDELPKEDSAAEPAAPVFEKKQRSREEVDAFAMQEDMTQLLYVIQKYLGKSLSGSDINTIMFINDTLGFSTDLIEYLFDYCVSGGHKSMRYIEKTAIGWAEQGIRDVNGAKMLSGIYADITYPVMKAFGLGGRRPAVSEVEYINKWIVSYGFDQKLVIEACNRTIGAIHQPSFEYADSILNRWKSEGIFTMDAVKAADEKFSADKKGKSARKKTQEASSAAEGSEFNNFHQRKYDFKALEAELLKK